MPEAADMTIPMLRDMRAENWAQHVQTRVLLANRGKCLGAVEDAQRSLRAALSADSLLSKLVTGEFQERLEALENRVCALESHG